MVDKNKFAEEEAEGYRLDILGRNVLVTEAMKNYVREKLAKIERFHTHIMDIHVTLDIQRIEHSVAILITFDHFTIKVHASSTDMYASIDKAVDRLQNQLRRWKGKIQDHRRRDIASIDMQVNVIRRPFDEVDDFNTAIEKEEGFFPPQVVKTKVIPLKNLNIEEAVMKIELSGDHFLLFKGEEDKKLKVIYRRSDGNYGIIAAE